MKRTLSVVFVLAFLVCLAWAQAPQAPPAGQQPAAPAPGGNAAPAGQAGQAGRGGRGAITPRILSFEASPTSIKPGEALKVTILPAKNGSPTGFIRNLQLGDRTILLFFGNGQD